MSDDVKCRAIMLNERTRSGGETGAGIMRNRCAFTSRDMAADWPEAFTYAVVLGWDDAMDSMAAKFEWDDAMVEFLRDAHRRFAVLADALVTDPTPDGEATT
jgi:hypothetical protein